MKTIAVKTKMKTIMACRVRAAMVKKEMRKDLMKTKRGIMTGNTSRNIPAGVLAACNTTRTAACMAWATNMNRNMNTIMIPNSSIARAGKATSNRVNMVEDGPRAHKETGAWAEAVQEAQEVQVGPALHAVASPACPKKKLAV